MQFEINATVFSATRVTVDGKVYSSIFTGQKPAGDNADNTLGFEITKIGSEPVVFDQLKAEGFRPGQDMKLLAILKKAANGKSQPFIVGVVPGQKATPDPVKKAS